MKKLALIILTCSLSAAIVTITSCKKNQPPVISLEEPDDNSTWSLTDSVHVEGMITDDRGLHTFSVIISYQGDTVFSQFPDVHDLKSSMFHYHFVPAAAGTYHLYLTATDHETGVATESRTFEVTP